MSGLAQTPPPLHTVPQAIQTFMLAVKHERDPNRKTMLQVKTKELLDRAEKLKDYLNDQRRRAEPGAPIVPTQPGAAGTQMAGRTLAPRRAAVVRRYLRGGKPGWLEFRNRELCDKMGCQFLQKLPGYSRKNDLGAKRISFS